MATKKRAIKKAVKKAAKPKVKKTVTHITLTVPKPHRYTVHSGEMPKDFRGLRTASHSYPFAAMKVGDWFIVQPGEPGAKNSSLITHAAKQYAKEWPGFRIGTRANKKGARLVERLPDSKTK